MPLLPKDSFPVSRQTGIDTEPLLDGAAVSVRIGFEAKHYIAHQPWRIKNAEISPIPNACVGYGETAASMDEATDVAEEGLSGAAPVSDVWQRTVLRGRRDTVK